MMAAVRYGTDSQAEGQTIGKQYSDIPRGVKIKYGQKKLKVFCSQRIKDQINTNEIKYVPLIQKSIQVSNNTIHQKI
jgi:hypothetical protein